MYLNTIATATAREKVTLQPDFLRTKAHYEDEAYACFYKAALQETPLSLALQASRLALSQAKIAAPALDAVVYAGSLLKDYASWSLSAALCRDLGASRAMFLDIYQGCNGALAGIQQAVDLLRARPAFEHVLVVVSFVLPEALGRHETVDRGCIFSDAGSAMIVSRDRGSYEICALEMGYNAALNDYFYLPYGGTEILKARSDSFAWPLIDIKSEFRAGLPDFNDVLVKPRDAKLLEAVAAAGLPADGIAWLILPNYCRAYMAIFLALFPHLPESKSSLPHAMDYSHMGAADVLVSLSLLDAQIGAGEYVLVCQEGVGFSYGGLVLKKSSAA